MSKELIDSSGKDLKHTLLNITEKTHTLEKNSHNRATNICAKGCGEWSVGVAVWKAPLSAPGAED